MGNLYKLSEWIAEQLTTALGVQNPDSCERRPASHAVYTLIQCTSLLVEKAGVTANVTFQDHRKKERMQARSTLDLKPVRKDTQSPKQEQSVAPQNGPWSNKKF